MKEACYSATAALDYARLHVEKHPESKVLVIASDIARYGAHTSGEPTQGAGSIAMLISQDPQILLLMIISLLKHATLWTSGVLIIQQRLMSMVFIQPNNTLIC